MIIIHQLVLGVLAHDAHPRTNRIGGERGNSGGGTQMSRM